MITCALPNIQRSVEHRDKPTNTTGVFQNVRMQNTPRTCTYAHTRMHACAQACTHRGFKMNGLAFYSEEYGLIFKYKSSLVSALLCVSCCIYSYSQNNAHPVPALGSGSCHIEAVWLWFHIDVTQQQPWPLVGLGWARIEPRSNMFLFKSRGWAFAGLEHPHLKVQRNVNGPCSL